MSAAARATGKIRWLTSAARGSTGEAPSLSQRTFAKAHDRAVKTYGEGERAHRVAYAALKHTHEKVGDHWEPKDGKGPSDPRAGNPRARENEGETFGGVDVNKPKRELYEDARRAGIEGRSRMSKRELARALQRASRRQTARARSGR